MSFLLQKGDFANRRMLRAPPARHPHRKANLRVEDLWSRVRRRNRAWFRNFEGVVVSDHQFSLFQPSQRAERYRSQLLDFMETHVYPAEAEYETQMRESGNPHHHPRVIEDLKHVARQRDLWNLFHPQWGPGFSNLEYAPLAEIMGRSPWLAPEACNCNAPDTGNMEVLTRFGSDEHKEQWLKPLPEGTIRLAFAMTEPRHPDTSPPTRSGGNRDWASLSR